MSVLFEAENQTWSVDLDFVREIRCIQIKIYPQTYIKSKYGAFYSNNEVRVHTLSFVDFTRSTKLKSSSPLLSSLMTAELILQGVCLWPQIVQDRDVLSYTSNIWHLTPDIWRCDVSPLDSRAGQESGSGHGQDRAGLAPDRTGQVWLVLQLCLPLVDISDEH